MIHTRIHTSRLGHDFYMTKKNPRMNPARNPIRSLAVSCLAMMVVVLMAFTAVGCGSKMPEISTIEWRLENRPLESGFVYESLSVFASIKDEDGLDNISELWVLNDEAALAWKLTDVDWIKTTEGSDTWIGGSSLTTPEMTGMPRGSYRFVAIDVAGQRAEKEFQVSGNFPDRKPPSISFSDKKMLINSTWPETLVLAFDGTRTLIASPGASSRPSSLSSALGQDTALRTAEIGAYGYDPALRIGAFSKRMTSR